MTLTLEQAKIVFEGLHDGYKPVESRLQLGKNTALEDPNVIQHLLGYRVPEEYKNGKLPLFDDVNNETKDIIAPYISKALEIIEQNTKSLDYIFLILSTDWCGPARHVKHIHTLLQDNPQRNITFSVPIPLYIDTNDPVYHKFYWNYRETLYPKITYTSHERMEKVKVEYSSIDIPKFSYSSLLFDSSRSIHYIDNTPHMYLWVVCDAVELLDDTKLVNGVHIKTHGDIDAA